MTVDALMAEYERLWQVFRDTPDRRGPDVPPRQVCFDIQRVENELKAAGVVDPFALIHRDCDALKFGAPIDVAESDEIEDPPVLEEAAPPAPATQPTQLALF
jgi:hypothetical protein